MEFYEEFCWFDKISDDILLRIFIFVPRTFWKDLTKVCTRFENICLDKEIFRVSDLTSAYGWSNQDLKYYLRAGCRYIETLHLSHCYWFSSLALSTYISKCKNIQHLSLLDCKLTTQGLLQILRSVVNLESLTISVSNLLDFSNAINDSKEVQKSLKNLKHFGLHNQEETVSYSANSIGFHVSQQVALFQHCPSIESFSVIGTPCIGQKFAKRLVHPLITKNNLCNLKAVSINDTENATSRLYFFSVLVRACKLPAIHFTNLSVAGLDFKKAATTHSYFVKSLQGSLPTLKRLDLSKSEIDEFETSMLKSESLNLTHLNLSHVRSEKSCVGLLNIASRCKNLVSLNLKGATSGCRVWGQGELNGLNSVLGLCHSLQDLNLAGIHLHEEDTESSLVDVLIRHNISEFKSLALSVCSLVARTTKKPEISNGYISKGLGKRQRISRVQEAGPASNNDSKGHNSLSDLSKSCPKLTSLEIIDADCRGSCIIPVSSNPNPCEQSHKFNDTDLINVANWKKLKYLQLTCLPGVKSLSCLCVKSDDFSNLKVLHLTNIGLGALAPGYWSILQYFTQLRDLRIEQTLMKLDERFYTPCLECIHLQRLVIVSRHCKVQSKPLENFVEKV
ncbi:F-box domain [Mactra antiquata]